MDQTALTLTDVAIAETAFDRAAISGATMAEAEMFAADAVEEYRRSVTRARTLTEVDNYLGPLAWRN
jgi:hypothetical protein